MRFESKHWAVNPDVTAKHVTIFRADLYKHHDTDQVEQGNCGNSLDCSVSLSAIVSQRKRRREDKAAST